MPEGDTVYKVARYLDEALRDVVLVAGSATLTRTAARFELGGRRVDAVQAHGKHLFVAFADGGCLRSHLGMHGSWHAYAAGERWRRPATRAGIVLDAGERVFVCFSPLQVEWMRDAGVRRRTLGVALGPDLLAPGVDTAQVVARAWQLLDSSTPVADVLLDQRVASGIGNVYKSEVLFLHRCHPARALGDCGDALLQAMYDDAARLLARNTGGGARRTRWANDEAGGLWVYGRRGQPCLVCDRPLQSAPLGARQRATFWCPACQPS
jgi:endonuclease-8